MKMRQADLFSAIPPIPTQQPAPAPPSAPTPATTLVPAKASAPPSTKKPAKARLPRIGPTPLNASRASLLDARDWLNGQKDRGATCPCCDQFAKIYRRKINSGMAAAILVIWRRTQQIMPRDGWLHIPDDFKGAGGLVGILQNREYPKLRYWGLLQAFEGPHDDVDTPYSGKWRITLKGREFCLGQRRVPKYVNIYNSEPVERQEDATVDIREALGDRFSYDDLMEGK